MSEKYPDEINEDLSTSLIMNCTQLYNFFNRKVWRYQSCNQKP